MLPNRTILSCRATLLLQLILFIIYLEEPADGFINSPKIITKDGNLIVESGLNRNITFRLDGTSRININDEYDLLDLLLVGGKYNRSSPMHKDIIEADNVVQLSNELSTLREYVFGAHGLDKLLNLMSNSTLSNNMALQRFRLRLRNVERKVKNLSDRLELDSCKSNPCENGGACINIFGAFICKCPKNFEGPNCQNDVNECALYAGTDLGCQNGGQCVNQHGGYNCICSAGWYGIHCTQRKADCMQSSAWELCGHGTCVSSNDDFGYKCICDAGWKTNGLTPSCTADVDECTESHPPCATTCINLPGSFTCAPCAAGLTGNGVNCRDIDECALQNGGCSLRPRVVCINSYGSYHCGDCPLGWIGDGRNCERRGGSTDGNGATATSCALNNYCHPLAKCTEVSNTVVCSCPAGMVGSGVGLSGCVQGTQQNCATMPCQNGGTCIDSGDTFICRCPMGYRGPTCSPVANPCTPNPCQNNGRCRATGGTQFTCQCAPGFSGRLCDNIYSRCGGILAGVRGHLKYPEGSAYDHMAQCVWIIRTNESLVLNVTFNAFELEDASECRFDWLQMNDGRSAASQIIGRFCGTHKPRGGNIVTSSSDLYLWFRSDNTTAKAGFELEWNSVAPQCGGIVQVESHGTLRSPGSPGNYPKNRDCRWQLRAPNNKRIKLTFFSLQIEKHESCNFDYLEVIDAIADSTIVKYCNSTSPAPLLLLTNEAIINFHSDNIETDAGFQIYYSTEERVPGCGGTYTAKEGIIASPNLQGDSISCEYDIKMPLSESIKIEFNKFEMGQDDCLEFYDTSPSTHEFILQGKYCGGYGFEPPVILHSLYNAVRIKYVAKDGKFELKYEADCSYNFDSESGEVLSPTYPKLGNIDRFCHYKITTEPNTVISVKFNDFDIKDSSVDANDCAFSSLRISDGLHQNTMGPYCGNSTPPVEFASKTNMLTLDFSTALTSSGRGFKLEYRSIPMGKTDCGGVFTKPGYKITVPIAEDNLYLNDLECYWVIMAPEGKGILLNWKSFSMEQTADCTYDYVEIYDSLGRNDDDRPLGRYCDTPPSISSHSRLLTLKFVSDSSEAGGGFEASYEFIDLRKQCGGEIFSSTGRIFSPDYPANYTNGIDCIWVINTPENTQIKLDVDMFELQTSENCENDWLEIRNGGSAQSPLINKYCGTLIPRQIPSFTHQLRLHFHSDSFLNARGFQIHWYVFSNGCGGNLKSDSGVITSPLYPNPYPLNAECDWHIQVPKGSSIHFTIADLEIEELFDCHYDYLEIFNGRSILYPRLAKLCRLETQAQELFTTGNEALLRFRSDSSQRERGFMISYYSNCSRTIRDLNGVIESPNFGNPYFNDPINCSWTIQAPKGNHIVLQFTHYENEKRYGGGGIVFKEPGKNETVMHLQSLNDNFTASGNALTIVQNNSWVNFRLEYTMFGCVEVFHHETGDFQSPNFPLLYPNDVECMWEIKTSPGQGVELTVSDMDIEETVNCTNDALVISSHYDSNNYKERHCGKHTNLVITSSSHHLFVRFISSKEHNGRGFNASYKILKSQCGGVLNSKNGVITSPNYPLNYPPSASCEWNIEVTPHHSITFTLEEIEMENYYSCAMDFVEAYEGDNSDRDTSAEERQLLFRECGLADSSKNKWVTTTNIAVVRFESDDSIQMKGFKLSFEENCGQRIEVDDDDVEYIAISRNVKTNETCEWNLIAKDLSKHVQFTPTHVQLSPMVVMSALLEEDCRDQGVKIYDGMDDTAPLRAKFCKTHPPSIISNGHALTIKVPLNVTTEFEGYFHLMDNMCGGYYTSLSGEFASPYYPSSYPVNINCEWYISASEGNTMVLTIESLDLEESEDCNKDYLEVRDTNESGRLLGVFCGKSIPTPITGVQTMWLKLSSDNDGVSNGFLVSYNYATHNEINGTNGTITSPHYPTKFNTDEPYTWRITVDRDYVLVVVIKHIIDVDMPFIKFYDGYSDIGLQIDYSNTNYVRSSTNILYIKASRGPFEVEWSALSNDELKDNETLEENAAICGKSLHSIDTGIVAFIHSPGYPNGYANSLNCNWVIMPSNPATHVTLQLTQVDLEDMVDCLADYVTVSASEDLQHWQELERLCKKPDNVMKDYHGAPYLKLNFVSDFSVNKTGFSARVSAACGSELTARQGLINVTNLVPVINSRETDCVWKINVRQSHRIRIRFMESYLFPDSQTNNCRSYFFVRNGLEEDSPFLGKGKYCDNNITDVLETTSNRAFIKFSRSSFLRFRAAFYYEEISHECSDTLLLTEGSPMERERTLNSPNHPNIPNPHSECIWRVQAPAHHIIAIEFKDQFDLAQSDSSSNVCDREYVQLNDGATELMPVIGIFCGKNKPNMKYTTGNVLRIKYFTDISEPHLGFKAMVSIGRCGGSYYENQGEIHSPDASLINGGREFECVYTIEVKGGSMIKLIVENMELPDTEECSQDSYVELQEIITYDGTDNITDTLRLCGNHKAKAYTIEANKLVVRYHIQKFSPLHSFKFTYAAIGTRCGETIVANRGTLYTPGYPQGVNQPTRCVWLIRVPKGKRVKVEIIDFDSGRAPNTTHSFGVPGSFVGRLSFANDLEMQSIIARVSSNPPAAVYSTDNTMAIDAFFLSFSQHRGFKLRFSSDEESLMCRHNIDLVNGEGVLHFSHHNDSDIYCSYDLKMQDNETLSLKVENYENNNTYYLHSALCSYISPLKLELNKQQIKPDFLCTNNTQAVVRLPYPVTMKLLGNRRNRLINLDLRYKVYKCGGIRSIFTDFNITQPQMGNHTGELECAWAVWPYQGFGVDDTDDLDNLAAGIQIEVTLSTDFKGSCEDQYLIIYGGPNQNFPHLGRFCTQSSIDKLVVERGVFVEYYTRNYETQSRFNLSLQQGSGCGGKLTYPYRQITVSDQYKNNIECVWELATEVGFHIGLYFTDRFFIESSKDCTKDYLLVQQKALNGTWEDVGRYCGREPPTAVNSTTTELRLIFRTDAQTVGDGFTANFERNCGGILYATAESQHMSSPGYPWRYENDLVCNYTIVQEQKSKTGVLMQFLDFEVEDSPITRCIFDNVTVQTYIEDSPPDETILCRVKRWHEFRGDKITVVLRTDHSFAAKGFKFAYSTNVCGYTIHNSSVIETPHQYSDGSFPPNSECNWNITAPTNHKILIKFEYFDYEQDSTCDFDGVEIYKSWMPVVDQRVAKFCGNLTGLIPPLHIAGNRALIRSYSDRSVNSMGFKALIIFLPNCDERIYLGADNSTYDFTKYASGYANSLDCAYVFATTHGRQLVAEFNSFHVEESEKCRDDFLEVRDGGGPFGDLIGTFCGHVAPQRMVSSQNALFLRFVSDSAVASSGFIAKITSASKICGDKELEVKSKEKVVLNSPNAPGQLYGKHLNCLWKLESSKTIHLKFERFDLEDFNSTGHCGGDMLKIYNKEDVDQIEKGYGTEVVMNGHTGGSDWNNYATDYVYCGNHLPDDFFSTGNTVIIKFQTDDSIEKTGFSISAFAVEGCFRNFTGTQGRIQIADTTDECDVYIEAPQNYTLSLYYADVVFAEYECVKEYIEVFNAYTNSSLQKICSYTGNEKALFSTTNKLRLHFKMSGYYTKFDFTYLASRDSPGCGGNLYNSRGTIVNPFYPNNVRNYSDCTWNIRVPSNLHVLLHFEVFDLGTKNTCHSDYLEISEPDDEGPDTVVRRFCGGDNPKMYKSGRSSLSIRFHKTLNYDGTGWVINFQGVYSNYKIPEYL